ncbi:DUF881 domain-containing protein [Aquipuribacter nitratireducens]|uniref:DUF881 domain-containing protein n=1 Tax=Aquipuribacter nitratireducens TaxID=650104 RepID=A0ABW0GS94_9MICO
MQRPLDPGYAVAHRRRVERGEPEERATRPGRDAWRATLRARAAPALVVGVLLGVVTGAGVAQLRDTPLETQDRAVLEAEIERRTAVADSLAETSAELRAEIEERQQAALADGSTGVLAASDRLALPVGAVPVVGEGVQVVLDDAAGVDDTSGFADDGRVRDGDVQTVVNGLWKAGAEGIAVNGQRLTALSTIRFAGSAIVVDLRPLARPYTIEAVGDPDALLEELRGGRTADYAQALRTNFGISVQADAVGELRLPPASRLTLRHATPVEEDQPEVGVGEDEQS